MAKFGYTMAYVDDVADELEFFTKTFDLKPKMVHPEGYYAELDTGSTILSFVSRSAVSSSSIYEDIKEYVDNKQSGMEIAFLSDDIQQDYRNAIKNGAKPLRDPEETEWGQGVSYVRTPQGLLLDICSKMDE